jgi:hypothetical protein
MRRQHVRSGRSLPAIVPTTAPCAVASGGSLSDRIEIKTTLSMPRKTISSAKSVRSDPEWSGRLRSPWPRMTHRPGQLNGQYRESRSPRRSRFADCTIEKRKPERAKSGSSTAYATPTARSRRWLRAIAMPSTTAATRTGGRPRRSGAEGRPVRRVGVSGPACPARRKVGPPNAGLHECGTA